MFSILLASKRGRNRQFQFLSNQIDHGSKSIKRAVSTRLALCRLNHGIDALADGIGQTFGEIVQDQAFVGHERGSRFLHGLQTAAAHP